MGSEINALNRRTDGQIVEIKPKSIFMTKLSSFTFPKIFAKKKTQNKI